MEITVWRPRRWPDAKLDVTSALCAGRCSKSLGEIREKRGERRQEREGIREGRTRSIANAQRMDGRDGAEGVRPLRRKRGETRERRGKKRDKIAEKIDKRDEIIKKREEIIQKREETPKEAAKDPQMTLAEGGQPFHWPCRPVI